MAIDLGCERRDRRAGFWQSARERSAFFAPPLYVLAWGEKQHKEQCTVECFLHGKILRKVGKRDKKGFLSGKVFPKACAFGGILGKAGRYTLRISCFFSRESLLGQGMRAAGKLLGTGESAKKAKKTGKKVPQSGRFWTFLGVRGFESSPCALVFRIFWGLPSP